MAKDRYEIDFSDDPVFNTVSGLTNITFDINNIVSGRGATEDQLAYVYGLIKALQDWLDENGCDSDPYGPMITELENRINELEQQILDCCSGNPYSGDDIGTGDCDGNTITVSFSWNGNDPFVDGGQANAVSADSSRQIVAYFFLVYESSTGLYRRSSDAFGGDWRWSISSSGAVTATHMGAVGPGNNLAFAKEIIAVDSQGCEGGLPISLPISHAVGG